MSRRWDAVVVGSGPNGLAAAIEIARAGFSVLVLEAAETLGGGLRSAEATLPGYQHDVCSAIHPMALHSPFFRSLDLAALGLRWLPFEVSVAHPLGDRPAAVIGRSDEIVHERLGNDADRWADMTRPYLKNTELLFEHLLAPPHLPLRGGLALARFAATGLRAATSVAGRFRTAQARALFAGCAAHSVLPLDMLGSGAFGLVFAVSAHAVDWPCAAGGSVRIAEALRDALVQLGGEYETRRHVERLTDLPPSRVVLLDTSPHGLRTIAADALPARYLRRLDRYRYGPGVFKVDWALDGPIPWRDPIVGSASTVHVGGTIDEIARSERLAWDGSVAEQPFLIVCQQSVVDRSRAPAGKHTGYAYCHVPAGCAVDMTERIEAQIERFAPGFRDVVLGRHATWPGAFEALNPNFIGGAVTGGAATITQVVARPTARLRPYTTPDPRLFLCSASTPPGGGVHGMCGFYAARAALRRLRR